MRASETIQITFLLVCHLIGLHVHQEIDREPTPDFPSTSKSAASPLWMLLTLIAMHQPSVSLLDLFLYLTAMVSVFLYLASAARLNAYSQFKTWDPVTWFCGGGSPASLQQGSLYKFHIMMTVSTSL